MIIDDVTSSGAAPALEMMIRFAGARQRILAHNIANVDTPNFRPTDVSTSAFQTQLRKAVEERRQRTGGETGELHLSDSREVSMSSGGLTLTPRTSSGNILFHDRNNRDLERTVQDIVENVNVFKTAGDLLRSRNETLKLAMNER